MTDKEDPRLGGRYPEFSRMSLRPGIGAPALFVLRDALLSPDKSVNVFPGGDVPRIVKIARSNVPLGRYLRSKLREVMGLSPEAVEDVKQQFFAEKQAEMQSLRESEAFTAPLSYEGEDRWVRAFVKSREQAILNKVARSKLKGHRPL